MLIKMLLKENTFDLGTELIVPVLYYRNYKGVREYIFDTNLLKDTVGVGLTFSCLGLTEHSAVLSLYFNSSIRQVVVLEAEIVNNYPYFEVHGDYIHLGE